jgi:heat shock protein HtpX
VLGHELTHIRNGDVRMLVIAVIIAGVLGFFAELLFRLMFQGGFRFGGAARPATTTAARVAPASPLSSPSASLRWPGCSRW